MIAGALLDFQRREQFDPATVRPGADLPVEYYRDLMVERLGDEVGPPPACLLAEAGDAGLPPEPPSPEKSDLSPAEVEALQRLILDVASRLFEV
jgi:hypothetical protein